MKESSKKYWTDDPGLVERYVLGQLSVEEKKRLDDEISDCEQCKEQLRREMTLTAGIRRHGRDAIRSRLRLNLRKDRSFQMQGYQVVGLVAAVIIIAVGIGLYQIWFSDLAAPKKFGNTEIVFKQPELPQSELKDEETSKPETEKTLKDEELRPSKRMKPERSAGKRTDKSAQGMTASKEIDRSSVSKSAPVQPPAAAYKKQITKSIWLLGTVVMVSESKTQSKSSGDIKLKMAEKSTDEAGRSKTEERRTVQVRRRNVNEEIVLQQRSFSELPRSRQTQMGKKNRVETLLEKNENGLQLTIYSDALTTEEIENAVVEPSSPDSLIISTSTQRIFYRLPSDLLHPNANPVRR